MNSLVESGYGIVELTQNLIDEILEGLDDATLAFTPGGVNPTLRELLQEQARIQLAYIESFRTGRADLVDLPNLVMPAEGVVDLRLVFEHLNSELKDAIGDIPDEELATRRIDRGGGFEVPVDVQMHIYRESVLITCGKVAVYLKAQKLPLSEQMQEWIG